MAKILVVDDEQDIVFLVTHILESVGHIVTGAASGEEALEKMRSDVPDLILLDIMMPGLDGWKTLELIRKEEGLEQVPVSMMTAKTLTAKTAARREFLELVDYIEKPFTRNSLINKVNYSIIEDLETISRNKKRLESVVGGERANQYEVAARLERLHKSILSTLKGNLDKIEPGERSRIKQAIEEGLKGVYSKTELGEELVDS